MQYGGCDAAIGRTLLIGSKPEHDYRLPKFRYYPIRISWQVPPVISHITCLKLSLHAEKAAAYLVAAAYLMAILICSCRFFLIFTHCSLFLGRWTKGEQNDRVRSSFLRKEAKVCTRDQRPWKTRNVSLLLSWHILDMLSRSSSFHVVKKATNAWRNMAAAIRDLSSRQRSIFSEKLNLHNEARM